MDSLTVSIIPYITDKYLFLDISGIGLIIWDFFLNFILLQEVAINTGKFPHVRKSRTPTDLLSVKCGSNKLGR